MIYPNGAFGPFHESSIQDAKIELRNNIVKRY